MSTFAHRLALKALNKIKSLLNVADSDSLKAFLKAGIAAKRPDLAPVAELLDPLVKPWLDRIQEIAQDLINNATYSLEKLLLAEFIDAWNRLITFLQSLDSLANSNQMPTPDDMSAALENKIVDVVKSYEHLDKAGLSVDKEKVHEMYELIKKVMLRLAEKEPELKRLGITVIRK